MIEALLIIQIVLLWFLLRPKQDWYVVEHQICYGKNISSSRDGAFGKLHLSAHDMTIERALGNSATLLNKDGGKINIGQTVFSELAPAKLHFETIKKLFPYGDEEEGHTTLYLRRIIARSRDKAITLPPETYYKKDGVVLEKFWSSRKPSEKENNPT